MHMSVTSNLMIRMQCIYNWIINIELSTCQDLIDIRVHFVCFLCCVIQYIFFYSFESDSPAKKYMKLIEFILNCKYIYRANRWRLPITWKKPSRAFSSFTTRHWRSRSKNGCEVGDVWCRQIWRNGNLCYFFQRTSRYQTTSSSSESCKGLHQVGFENWPYLRMALDGACKTLSIKSNNCNMFRGPPPEKKIRGYIRRLQMSKIILRCDNFPQPLNPSLCQHLWQEANNYNIAPLYIYCLENTYRNISINF